MKMLRTYIAWLALPAVLIVITLIYALPGSGRRGNQEFDPDHADIIQKDKLSRTMKALAAKGKGSQVENMGTPGLPLELLIRENEWDDLLNKRNVRRNYKKKRHDIIIRVNETSLLLGTYKIRGTSSNKIAYRSNHPDHLCYAITLFEPIEFAPGIKLKKFYLMNMISDRHYYEMRFSYNVLQALGLFPSYSQFVAMKINGTVQGLYLLIERPKDAIRRTSGDVSGIYRRRSIREDKRYARFKTVLEKPRMIEKQHIKKLYEIAREKQGSELIEGLEAVMNLEAYLTWLAFNSLVRNSDVQDEVFFYVAKSEKHPDGRVELMAWDYDDIMVDEAAHPDFAFKDPLLFACEAELDHLIKKEPVLYNRFKKVMRALFTRQLTEQRLRTAIEQVREEVNGIDTGLPPEKQREMKAERNKLMDEFETKLFARRKELLCILEPNSRLTQIQGDRQTMIPLAN